MPAPVITPIDPDRIPQRDGSQKQNTYSDNMDYFAATLPVVVDQQNLLGTWMNDTAGDIQDNADSAAASESSAISAKNTAVAAAASAINSPGTNATSTSSITPVKGSNSFTLDQTGKAFVVNQFVTVANSPTKFFTGAITAFNPSTGDMTVDARTVEGTGSASAWTITASAPAQGETFTAPVQKFVNLGTVSGTVNIDLRSGLKYSFTTSGNITINPTLPSLATSSTEVEAVYKITKGGSHTITWPVGTQWSDGAPEVHNSGATNEYVATKEGSGAWINSTSRKNIS